MVGGALVCLGAALPWLTFFAGLQSYSGLVGLYGRIVFAGGILAITSAVATRLTSPATLRPMVGALGVALAIFVCWLLAGLRSTTQALGMHAMLIARPGPGLFVALAGSLLLTSVLLPGARRLRLYSGRYGARRRTGTTVSPQ